MLRKSLKTTTTLALGLSLAAMPVAVPVAVAQEERPFPCVAPTGELAPNARQLARLLSDALGTGEMPAADGLAEAIA